MEIALIIILAVGWALALRFGVLVWRMLFDRGRLLLQIEALEQRLGEIYSIPDREQVAAEGFPVGSPGPDFALPDLDGTERPLEEWRGRRLVLVFFDPDCRFSMELLPELAAVRAESELAIVATGEPDRMRALAAEHDLPCPVLLQESTEVFGLFRVVGTPSAYALDENGRIAAPLALGGDAVLELVRGRTAPRDAGATTRIKTKSLADSRLLRTGLEAGTVAPAFTLPNLDGGTTSLADYRGRRVLLAFVDPECAPCDILAPSLERIHRERDDLAVLAVSRGDAKENRRKAKHHGLTFPIVLQRHWDTSLDYGMFAVPIAWLVDEEGVLETDIAIGHEKILQLAATEKGVAKARA
jgi:peroxiredoxin